MGFGPNVQEQSPAGTDPGSGEREGPLKFTVRFKDVPSNYTISWSIRFQRNFKFVNLKESGATHSLKSSSDMAKPININLYTFKCHHSEISMFHCYMSILPK
jgi:hypothetical protein